LNPKGHVDACSFISHFGAEIITDEICPRGDEFYGIFLVNGHPELFDILSSYSSDIILEFPPDKTLK
jgi:hypothetical protein